MNTALPALSLRQPWAWAVLHAGKTIENRTWATKYRGRIRIHAAKTWDPDGWQWLKEHDADPPLKVMLWRASMLGAYVGEVTVVYCSPLARYLQDRERQRETPSPWAFGPICWQLKDPIAYPEPIPGRGYPGLYLPERFERRAA